MMDEEKAVNNDSTRRYGATGVEVEIDRVESAVEGMKVNELTDSSANRTLPLRCLGHLLTVVAMCLATYVGVSTRIGLTLVSQSMNFKYFPSLYAQIVGTFIMGLLLPFKDILNKNHAILYTSLSTGLCGCITTFSSWNAETASMLLQLNETSLQFLNAQNTMTRVVGSGIAIILGVGMPLSALRLGNNIGLVFQAINVCERKPLRIIRRCLMASPVVYCLTITTWMVTTVLLIFLCKYYDNFDIMFALLLGQAGTYIRWHLGRLDRKTRNCARGFPVGTFIANIAGSFVLAFALVCKTSFAASAGSIWYSVLTGVVVGFCGCLTTVSTFASQLSSLSFKMSVVYAVTSVVVAQVEFVCILGGYAWIK